MLALLREMGIPCRYVSGYLYYPRDDHNDRSAQDATHAWVEALLPEVGWVGFDPTNNLICGERHIRVAIGRDYADVPPTRGVFKGDAETELSVAVRVVLASEPATETEANLTAAWTKATLAEGEDASAQQQQQ
jgi:transglutaminase-like putative cysteine protease